MGTLYLKALMQISLNVYRKGKKMVVECFWEVMKMYMVSNIVFSKMDNWSGYIWNWIGASGIYMFYIYSRKANSALKKKKERKKKHQDTSRPIRSHSGLYERSQLRTFRRSPRRWKGGRWFHFQTDFMAEDKEPPDRLHGTSFIYLCLSRDGGPSGPATSWPPPPVRASGWPWPWPRMWRAGRRNDGGGSASAGPCRCSGTSPLWWGLWARWSCRHCPWQWTQRSLHRNEKKSKIMFEKHINSKKKKLFFFYTYIACLTCEMRKSLPVLFFSFAERLSLIKTHAFRTMSLCDVTRHWDPLRPTGCLCNSSSPDRLFRCSCHICDANK